MFDWLPGVSQLKSVCKILLGDVDGAIKTQTSFLRTCPLISQVVAGAQALTGHTDEAKETLKQGLSIFDPIPGVGHIKGLVQYAVGDKEGGAAAIKAASHTTGAMIGGGLGMLVGGPAGAYAGGVAGGILTDVCITKYDSKVNNEYIPYGVVQHFDNIKQRKMTIGDTFDMVTSIAVDGILGYQAAKRITSVSKKDNKRTKLADEKTTGQHIKKTENNNQKMTSEELNDKPDSSGKCN